MMNTAAFVGNLTNDPQLIQPKREGAQVRTNFTVAVNTGSKDNDNEKTHFLRCTAWGFLAEHVVQSLGKGNRVIVYGSMDTFVQDFIKETDDGEKEVSVTQVQFKVNAIGPDLMFQTAKVTKAAVRRNDDVDPYEETDEEDEPKQARSRRTTKSTKNAKPEADEEVDDEVDDEDEEVEEEKPATRKRATRPATKSTTKSTANAKRVAATEDEDF